MDKDDALMKHFIGSNAPKPISWELTNEKRYTVRELLASEEAMKDLLHERLLAVRDDLNFAINQCNPNINLQNFLVQIRGIQSSIHGIQVSQEKFQRDVVDALGLIREDRWWKRAWTKIKEVRRGAR